MGDYQKWDKLEDSDEEEEKRLSRLREEHKEVNQTFHKEQDSVELWLKRQEAAIHKGEDRKELKDHREDSPPELGPVTPALPVRRLTKEERKAVAMLMVISHFEEGTTNLERHPQMLELLRHNRWLEEDPGTLELLCRAHNLAMKSVTASGPGEGNPGGESEEDARMRALCFSAINTLAAPKGAGCSGGLLELVTQICTPETDKARELRKKWERKEFGKQAIFDSLFPELRKDAEAKEDSGWLEIGLIVSLVFILIAVFVLIMYAPGLAGGSSKGAAAKLAGAVGAAPLAAAPAGGGAAGAAAAAGDAAGAAARKIEELQREIAALKMSQAVGDGGAGPAGEL